MTSNTNLSLKGDTQTREGSVVSLALGPKELDQIT